MAHNDYADLYGRTLKFASSNDTTSAQGFVNDAYREIVALCDLNPKVSSAIALTAGTMSYTITGAPFSIADMMALQHVYYTSSGQLYRMEPIALEAILELRAYSAASAPPGMYYNLNGVNNLEIYPAPVSSDTMTLYYIGTPTALSAPTDVIANTIIPTEYQYLVAARAAMYLADYEDPESWISYTVQDRYNTGMVEFRKFLRNRKGEQQKRIRVGYLNRHNWARHDNSQYFSGDR